MTGKPVYPHAVARLDVEHSIDWYLKEAGEDVALGFIDAIEAAYRAIALHPAAGSPLYAHELNLSGLRSYKTKRYPYLIFYMERPDHIDVWRVLHVQRDIPVTLQDGES